MIDARKVRVGLEIDGELRLFEDLHVKASGTKFSNPTQNDCSITITNLSAETRAHILSAVGSQKSKDAIRLSLEVGRASLAYYRLFVGDIIDATQTAPPDIGLSMKCKTNRQGNAKIIVEAEEDDIKLSELSKKCADNNGLELVFQAQDRLVAGYSFNGTASQQIEYLQRIGGVSCFVDDGTLAVTKSEAPLSGRIRVLNIASGLVGIPKRTPKGAQIQFLIDAETKIGGVVTLESKSDQTLSGDYRVAELKFDIDTHGEAFFYTIEGVRI